MLKGIVNRRRSLIAALILAASIPARGAVTVTAEADVVHLNRIGRGPRGPLPS